jgi:LmbE family N-acetylglucosaminyl deacetylase
MTKDPETEIKRLTAQIHALRMTVVFLISAMDGVGPGGNADHIVVQLLSQKAEADGKDALAAFAIEDIIALIDDIREP